MSAVASRVVSKPQRLYYIDWLRLFAVFLLFTFHSARIFDPWESFYVQNDQLSSVITYVFIWAVGPWHMCLFFLLAGASTYFALRFRSGTEYTNERFKRLFVPLVFGVLVLIPPQSYLGLLNHSDYSQSFFSWFPNFFHLQADDPDGYFLGGFTLGHLWFILHLFVYSLVALPLFLYLNRQSGLRWIKRLAGAFTNPLVLFLVVPLLLVAMSLCPEIAGGNPLFYIAFFISGFMLMSDPRFIDTVDRWRLVLLVLGAVPLLAGIIVTGIANSAGGNATPTDTTGWAGAIIDGYVAGFVPWFVVLALLGYGRRLLNFTNGFLRYFAPGAYPLYILHQTVIVIVGFFVVQWALVAGAKYVVIVALAFAGTVFAYDVLVKRTNVTRFLFGMKPKSSSERAAA